MSIEQTLAALRSQISTVTQKRARVEVEHDQAQQRLQTAQQALKDEFGVSTTPEAQQKLLALREAVTEAIDEARKGLEAASA